MPVRRVVRAEGQRRTPSFFSRQNKAGQIGVGDGATIGVDQCDFGRRGYFCCASEWPSVFQQNVGADHAVSLRGADGEGGANPAVGIEDVRRRLDLPASVPGGAIPVAPARIVAARILGALFVAQYPQFRIEIQVATERVAVAAFDALDEIDATIRRLEMCRFGRIAPGGASGRSRRWYSQCTTRSGRSSASAPRARGGETACARRARWRGQAPTIRADRPPFPLGRANG